MKSRLFAFALLTGIIISIGNLTIVAQTDMKPPVAKKETKVTNVNGVELRDDYHWLRSSKDPQTGKVRPEVEEYLTAENAYTEAYMKSTEGLQKCTGAESSSTATGCPLARAILRCRCPGAT